MKKLLLAFAFLLFNFCCLMAQDSIVVKLNLTDCHNCYGGFCSIEKLPQGIKTVLVLKESDQKISGKFIRSRLGLKRNYSIIHSDSLFNSLNHIPLSEIYLYNSAKLIYTSGLESYSMRDFDNLFRVDTLFTLPDSIAMSPAVRIKTSGHLIALDDKIFNEIYLIHLTDQKILKLFNKETFPVDTFYKWVNVDSVSLKLFTNARSWLKTTQNDVSLMDDCCFLDDHFIISGSYPLMKKRGGDTVILSRKHAILSMPISDVGKTVFYALEDFHYESRLYYPLPSNLFPVSKSEVIFQSVSSDSLKPYMLNIWQFENGKADNRKLVTDRIPEYYLKTGLGTNFLTEIIAWPFLFYSLSPEVINLETGQKYILPFQNKDFTFSFNDIQNVHFDFQILDACFIDNVLKIMVLEKEKTIKILELDAGKFTVKKTLFFPDHFLTSKTTLAFWTKGRLIGLTREGNIISVIYSSIYQDYNK